MFHHLIDIPICTQTVWKPILRSAHDEFSFSPILDSADHSQHKFSSSDYIFQMSSIPSHNLPFYTSFNQFIIPSSRFLHNLFHIDVLQFVARTIFVAYKYRMKGELCAVTSTLDTWWNCLPVDTLAVLVRTGKSMKKYCNIIHRTLNTPYTAH